MDNNKFEDITKFVTAFIYKIIRKNNQPAARELLVKVIEEFGWQARDEFEAAIKPLRSSSELTKYQKDYLNSILSSEEIDILKDTNLDSKNEYKSQLDELFKRSLDYRKSDIFFEAIQFATKFKDYAPYNNLLVKIQNPSCVYYATEKDWIEKFERTIKEDGRPMLILAPMHPVMLVYDLDQTEGKDFPEHFKDFATVSGDWNEKHLVNLLENANRYLIPAQFKELGSLSAGFATTRLKNTQFKLRIAIHDNLSESSKFSVLVHEMAHIFLGHLGKDKDDWWPCRVNLSHSTVEIEAESVSYIVCNRLGIETSAPSYLAGHLRNNEVPKTISVDLIFKVAGKLEKMAKNILPNPKHKKRKISEQSQLDLINN